MQQMIPIAEISMVAGALCIPLALHAESVGAKPAKVAPLIVLGGLWMIGGVLIYLTNLR